MESFAAARARYAARHTTRGCKITHMIGIPLIALSVPALLINRRCAFLMFGVGWALQFTGHAVFEKNSPVFLENPFDVFNYGAALLFCKDEWSAAVQHLHRELMEHKTEGQQLDIVDVEFRAGA